MRPGINKIKTVITSWSLVTFKLHNSDSKSVKVGKPNAVGFFGVFKRSLIMANIRDFNIVHGIFTFSVNTQSQC